METTVAKGFTILELLARSGGPMRLAAIAEQLDLQKSNVHRLVTTLSELGYVRKDSDTGRYGLTLRLWELGTAVRELHPARRAAAPYMQELHKATSETVNLSVLDGDDVLYIDKIMAPRELRFTSRAGSRAPAALVVPGRALLAHEPAARDIVERVAQAAKGRNIDVETYIGQLEEVRRKGYVAADSIMTPGVLSVAAPILGRDGRSAAALSVSGQPNA